MELLIGKLLTHGMKIGEIKDSLKLEEDSINVESNHKSMLVFQLLKLKQLHNDQKHIQ
jgi:hypothetical protein